MPSHSEDKGLSSLDWAKNPQVITAQMNAVVKESSQALKNGNFDKYCKFSSQVFI
jgi:hypothetical protein